MIRLLFPVLFLAIQGAGIATAAACHGPICDWATGGYWVAPAVRIPLVAAGVIVAEIALLAVAWPGARWGATRLTRERGHLSHHAFDAAEPTASATTELARTH
jgi:hypothetical protein